MIILDSICHMVSTTSEKELHKFAKKLGFKRSWYHDSRRMPHYDVTTPNMRRKVIDAGARVITDRRKYFKMAWWNGTKRGSIIDTNWKSKKDKKK